MNTYFAIAMRSIDGLTVRRETDGASAEGCRDLRDGGVYYEPVVVRGLLPREDTDTSDRHTCMKVERGWMISG